jgi:hypothetical protein
MEILMSNNRKIILHLCADIGSDSKPYAELPDIYDVRLIGSNIGVENYNPPENVYGIIANPPCTHFSIARTNAKSPRDMKEGMRLVKECLRIIWECQYQMIAKHIPHKLKFWYIENPSTGYLKHFLGNPIYEYCPSEFREDYTKKTSLWGYFNKPIKPFFLVGEKLKGKSSDLVTPMNYRNKYDRMNERSKCSYNFAKAFFEVNQ